MSNEYALVDLEEKRKNGEKWFIGPFRSDGSSEQIKVIEIGYVCLQEVNKDDRLHFHERCEETFIVLEGQMEIQVGDKRVVVKKGQVLLVRARVPHLIRAVRPGTRIVLIKAPPSPGDKVDVDASTMGEPLAPTPTNLDTNFIESRPFPKLPGPRPGIVP